MEESTEQSPALQMRSPARPVIVYDGACGLCRGAVAWIAVRDPARLFEFLPLQNPELGRRYPQLSRAACERAMHLMLADGRVLIGADAIPWILRHLPGWGLAGTLLGWKPARPLAHAVYRAIARTRRRDESADHCAARNE